MTAPSWLDREAWPFPAQACHLADGALHYVTVGHGPTVVLVHGTPTWGFEWRRVIGPLAQTHRVIVPDHLGFGLSDRPGDADYSPEAHARRFAAFMADVVGDQRVSLVVHDFGGPIALPWVLENAHRIDALVVLNSWMWSFEDDPVMRRRAAMIDGAVGRLLYRYANASLRLIMPSAYARRQRLTRTIHAQYLNVFPDADSRERVLFALARSLRGSSAFFHSLWARRATLAALPLSIVWGTRDSAFGLTVLERWTEAFPHADVTRLDDAGHWPHEEQPAQTVAAIHRALRNQPPRVVQAASPTPPQPTRD
jgi:haloalkane dehalogenase